MQFSFLCFGCPILPNYRQLVSDIISQPHAHHPQTLSTPLLLPRSHHPAPGSTLTCLNHSSSTHAITPSTPSARSLSSAICRTQSTHQLVPASTILASTLK